MFGGDVMEYMENDSFWLFGGGFWNCIGMGFVMMEVILVSFWVCEDICLWYLLLVFDVI